MPGLNRIHCFIPSTGQSDEVYYLLHCITKQWAGSLRLHSWQQEHQESGCLPGSRAADRHCFRSVVWHRGPLKRRAVHKEEMPFLNKGLIVPFQPSSPTYWQDSGLWRACEDTGKVQTQALVPPLREPAQCEHGQAEVWNSSSKWVPGLSPPAHLRGPLLLAQGTLVKPGLQNLSAENVKCVGLCC